ncbi:GGDEF domain-containing protein [Vibrio ordalii]|uniref:diguanylate cyclase n=1 Tax=Vibrio ordalii FS-238 TaxID=617133 RepID=A0A853R1M2_9VIBR|nr:GGDEF domain-containing protein [Vibrio ordalii]OEE31759.1 diguanylate cyclase [Vibrio ordalii FS-238]
MDDKILQSVVEITGQKNAVSLGYCVISALVEMLPLKSACLEHYIGPHSYVIAKATICSRIHGKFEINWEYEGETVPSYGHNHSDIEPKIEDLGTNGYHCIYPIAINDSFSARLSLILKVPPKQYQMLIEGFVKIYQNYVLLLHENERDKLTGLLNRRTLEDRLRLSFDVLPETTTVGSVMPWVAIIDLDHFKRINDNFGHLIGDEVLLLVAQQMQNFFLNQEQLFRFGGEEFVIIFPASEYEVVLNRTERFRQHIEQFRFPQVQHITLSIGICSISPREYLSTILDRADKALYFAKNHGRNQVQCYEDLLRSGVFIENEEGDSSAELF